MVYHWPSWSRVGVGFPHCLYEEACV